LALQAEGLELSQLFYFRTVFNRLKRRGSVAADVFLKAVTRTKSNVPAEMLKVIVTAISQSSQVSQGLLNSFLSACKLTRPDGTLNKSTIQVEKQAYTAVRDAINPLTSGPTTDTRLLMEDIYAKLSVKYQHLVKAFIQFDIDSVNAT
jgi:hypothetical protein